MRKSYLWPLLCAVVFAGALVMPAGVSSAAMSDGDFLNLCRNGTPKQIEEAIAGGANVNAKNNNNDTALMYVASYNPSVEVLSILIENGANVNSTNKSRSTALMFAARRSTNPEIISKLIESGAKVDAIENRGNTALILGTMQNPSVEIVSALVKGGANINIKNNNGWSAMDVVDREPNVKNKAEKRKALLSK